MSKEQGMKNFEVVTAMSFEPSGFLIADYGKLTAKCQIELRNVQVSDTTNDDNSNAA